MVTLRAGLPPLPERIKRLPLDDRGYPVPWFVHWQNGKPEFRVLGRNKFEIASQQGRCWICGGKLVGEKAFVIGPMCAVNRVSSEPPSHFECAMFAAIACPFLTIPSAKRRDAGLPEEKHMPGIARMENPGVALVWVTDSYEVFEVGRVVIGNPGKLVRIGEPISVHWLCEGREATYQEVKDAIDAGIPSLRAIADRDPMPGAHAHLEEQLAAIAPLLPSEVPS